MKETTYQIGNRKIMQKNISEKWY